MYFYPGKRQATHKTQLGTSDIVSPSVTVTAKQKPTVSTATGETDLDPKWLRLALNGTNQGFFLDQIQYILARRAKMY